MKCIFQFLSADGSSRSEPMSLDRSVFADFCADQLDQGKVPDTALVLVLMDSAKGDLRFSQAPLLSVRNFVSQFSTKEVRVHG